MFLRAQLGLWLTHICHTCLVTGHQDMEAEFLPGTQTQGIQVGTLGDSPDVPQQHPQTPGSWLKVPTLVGRIDSSSLSQPQERQKESDIPHPWGPSQ